MSRVADSLRVFTASRAVNLVYTLVMRGIELMWLATAWVFVSHWLGTYVAGIHYRVYREADCALGAWPLPTISLGTGSCSVRIDVTRAVSYVALAGFVYSSTRVLRRFHGFGRLAANGGILAIGWGLMVFLYLVDPGGVVEWVID